MSRVILPGVAQIFFPRALVNAFLVNADVVTLVDAGTPGSASKVLAAVREVGLAPGDVKRILITHRHADHAGNAAELAAATGADVHVPPGDAAFVTERREQPRPRPATPMGQALVPYVKVALPWELDPVAAQPTLVDGASIGAFRVIDTPGHTAGHVSLLWQGPGVLFTGDAAANLTRIGPHPASDDPQRARESFAKLSGLDFESACFGHGFAVRRGAAAAFRAAA